jgi:all-trans-retinol 13,14-reductase
MAELWQPWENTLSCRRGKAYKAKKQQIAFDLIDRAERVVGPLKDVKLLDAYTPLTIRDRVHSPNGSAYGVQRTTDQLLSAALLNRTSLKGLYMAGQSVLAPGILGTILGSFATIKFILGPDRFCQEIVL